MRLLDKLYNFAHEARKRTNRGGWWFARNIFSVLDVMKFLGILILVLMFIRFSVIVTDNTRTARETAQTTQRLVKSQADILKAIQQLAMDTKVTSEQKTNIIICMLQVPVDQRTTDVVNGCRQQVEAGVASPVLSTTPAQIAPTVMPAPAPNTATISPTTSPTLLEQILQDLGFNVKVKKSKK